ncbi:hypothetical protein M5K25_006403 [Dendrobium thyrsiflorum]|uniref:Uncharacterized protein n=1 Tax=Dendrobium thyrsiflorum TaxID=117978 RepID=A0ABD0VCP7_DENTH
MNSNHLDLNVIRPYVSQVNRPIREKYSGVKNAPGSLKKIINPIAIDMALPSPSNEHHNIDEWPTPILIPASFTTSKVSSTSSIQLSSTSIQGSITLLKDTWSIFSTPSSKPSKNNSTTFSGTLLRILNKGELLPLFICLLNSTNLVGKEMGTDVKAEECEWRAHELEPNPRPLKRRFVFWYTRRTKVHPPPPLPALEATLDVPPPKPQDVLFYSKVHGPVKRRKVSAIRQFPPGCGPGSGAATSV